MTTSVVALVITGVAVVVIAWVYLDGSRLLRRRNPPRFDLRELERAARQDEQLRLSEVDRLVLHATDRDRRVHRDCQTGNADVCQLAKVTGITCPADSCDIDDGVR